MTDDVFAELDARLGDLTQVAIALFTPAERRVISRRALELLLGLDPAEAEPESRATQSCNDDAGAARPQKGSTS